MKSRERRAEGGERMKYTDLIVWQKSMELVEVVYRLVRTFPADERFRLCDQLSRAVVSIPSNIAEGNGRESSADYSHFLKIARGSLFETMTQLEIARRLGYLRAECGGQRAESGELRAEGGVERAESLANEIRAMLTAMISKLRSAK